MTTLLLSPAGRLLFRVVVVPGPTTTLLAEGDAGEGGAPVALPDWVDRYTFAEEARLQPLPHAVSLVLGPLAGWPSDSTVTGQLLRGLDHAVQLAWSDRRPPDAPPLPEAALAQLRVRHGEPAAGAELTSEYHPLEANLEHAVSFTKGCYTGQEVVARQDSRGKVARRLVVLASDGLLVPGDAFVEEMKAGCRVTTVAPEAMPSGQHLSLAYVAARSSEPGSVVTTRSGAAARVIAPPG